MLMHLDQDHRIFVINTIVLVLIIVLIVTMPRGFFERIPPEPPLVYKASPAATSGEETLLVLLSEYNFDHEPRFTTRIAPGARFCTSIPFIESSQCTTPTEELAFLIENETSSGVLGYAVMDDTETARALMSRYARITQAADGSYLSVTDSISSITDHALISAPDDMLVFYHPVGSRYEHAWIARFERTLIYGYENTPERTITRKFTHAFDAKTRHLVMERYDLSVRALARS
jgi:hypothetical protein